jgi:hypothetical protein
MPFTPKHDIKQASFLVAIIVVPDKRLDPRSIGLLFLIC